MEYSPRKSLVCGWVTAPAVAVQLKSWNGRICCMWFIWKLYGCWYCPLAWSPLSLLALFPLLTCQNDSKPPTASLVSQATELMSLAFANIFVIKDYLPCRSKAISKFSIHLYFCLYSNQGKMIITHFKNSVISFLIKPLW